MATPRKRYFRVADQVLREGWTDSDLATLIRLMAYLNGRWARDGIPNESSGDAVLTPGDVLAVAGLTSPRRARERLLSLARTASLTSFKAEEVRRGHGVCVRISWPKWPRFQFDAAPKPAGDGAGSGSDARAPKSGRLEAANQPSPRPASRSPRPAISPDLGGALKTQRGRREVSPEERAAILARLQSHEDMPGLWEKVARVDPSGVERAFERLNAERVDGRFNGDPRSRFSMLLVDEIPHD